MPYCYRIWFFNSFVCVFIIFDLVILPIQGQRLEELIAATCSTPFGKTSQGEVTKIWFFLAKFFALPHSIRCRRNVEKRLWRCTSENFQSRSSHLELFFWGPPAYFDSQEANFNNSSAGFSKPQQVRAWAQALPWKCNLRRVASIIHVCWVFLPLLQQELLSKKRSSAAFSQLI